MTVPGQQRSKMRAVFSDGAVSHKKAASRGLKPVTVPAARCHQLSEGQRSAECSVSGRTGRLWRDGCLSQKAVCLRPSCGPLLRNWVRCCQPCAAHSTGARFATLGGKSTVPTGDGCGRSQRGGAMGCQPGRPHPALPRTSAWSPI
jgi:hypothetical protein